MACSLGKVGGPTVSVLKTACGVFELKAVQVTKGSVNEDGSLEFSERDVLLFTSHLCWELNIFPALWLQQES